MNQRNQNKQIAFMKEGNSCFRFKFMKFGLAFMSAQTQSKRRRLRSSGWTLIQLLTVMAIVAVLSAGLFNVVGRSRVSAQRMQCDARLKAVALALDAHRQEYGEFPARLQILLEKK